MWLSQTSFIILTRNGENKFVMPKSSLFISACYSRNSQPGLLVIPKCYIIFLNYEKNYQEFIGSFFLFRKYSV